MVKLFTCGAHNFNRLLGFLRYINMQDKALILRSTNDDEIPAWAKALTL